MPISPRRMQCEFAETQCEYVTFYRRADVGIGPYERKHDSVSNCSLTHRRGSAQGFS